MQKFFETAVPLARRQSELATDGTLPYGEVLGIAAAGSVVLFALLVCFVIYIVKFRHRRAMAQISASRKLRQDVGKELEAPLESRHPSTMWRRSSSNPFSAHPYRQSRTDHWGDEDGIYEPDTPTKSERMSLSMPKGLYRISGMRDSWPLVAAIQMPTIQLPVGGLVPTESSPNINLTPPHAAVITSEPRWPKRTNSRASRQIVPLPSAGSPTRQPPSKMDNSNTTMPRQTMHKRRSTSESQLSSILRSTSQRLKDARRQSFIRTRSSLTQVPGLPPTEDAPVPPQSRRTESREGLIDWTLTHYAADSINDSIYGGYISRSPSPSRKIPRSSGQVFPKQGESPTPSGGSDDSLCGVRTPDLSIPATLSSPGKRGSHNNPRHRPDVPSVGATDISAIIHKDSRASINALGKHGQDSIGNKPTESQIAPDGDLPSPARTSTTSDVPKLQILGPRPLNIRKSTFEQEAIKDKSSRPSSPLRDLSNNEQSLPKSATAPNPQSPFRWSPQEAMPHKTNRSSPEPPKSRRKGHQRSQVFRMSGLPMPLSVGMVPEVPEDDLFSPVQSSHVDDPALKLVENLEPPTSSRRRGNIRPPSMASFNSSLVIPTVPSSGDTSPNLGHEDTRSAYSSTLSFYNYYTERRNSDEEFLQPKRTPSLIASRRKGRDLHIDNDACLTSFPALNLSKSTTPVPTTSPIPQPLSFTSSPALPVQPDQPAPALLTVPLVNGTLPNQTNTTHSSLEASIGMLRRMNSEVSTYSTVSSMHSEDSPTLPDLRGGGISPLKRSKIKASHRGSKHYLSIGTNTSSSDARRSPIRHTLSRQHRKQNSQAIYEAVVKEARENYEPLVPVKENSTVYKDSDGLGIQNMECLTQNDAESTTVTTAPMGNADEETRWSDAMVKPKLSVVRRESKIEMPTPQTPPKWGWGLGRAEENADKRSSLGLYDDDGFLRCSPRLKSSEDTEQS